MDLEHSRKRIWVCSYLNLKSVSGQTVYRTIIVLMLCLKYLGSRQIATGKRFFVMFVKK